MRRDDKSVFDVLQTWWSLNEGRTLSQWEVFTRLLALAVEHPEAKLPPGAFEVVR